MVTIRPATTDDTPAIAEMHAASARELGRRHYDETQVRAWAGGKRPERYPVDEPGEYFVVATAEGTDIAGFGHLQLDEGEVQAVYVNPEYARRGVGSALLAHLEATAKESGLTECHLWASLNAVPFYEQAGWQVVDSEVVETSGDGVTATLPVKIMEKSLRASPAE
jgi:putative acetyltransferase